MSQNILNDVNPFRQKHEIFRHHFIIFTYVINGAAPCHGPLSNGNGTFPKNTPAPGFKLLTLELQRDRALQSASQMFY